MSTSSNKQKQVVAGRTGKEGKTKEVVEDREVKQVVCEELCDKVVCERCCVTKRCVTKL